VFKEELKRYRNINNLTQDELAAKMYISRTLVTKWESGSVYPTKEHIFKLSEILNVTIKELFTKEEINKIFFSDYKTKPIEKVLLSISSILVVTSITLLIFSFILENTLTSVSNIRRVIPPTRYVLFCLVMVAIIFLIIECVFRRVYKHKHMYKY
jgi:transcriptional regulator with XRE-family HTH domain